MPHCSFQKVPNEHEGSVLVLLQAASKGSVRSGVVSPVCLCKWSEAAWGKNCVKFLWCFLMRLATGTVFSCLLRLPHIQLRRNSIYDMIQTQMQMIGGKQQGQVSSFFGDIAQTATNTMPYQTSVLLQVLLDQVNSFYFTAVRHSHPRVSVSPAAFHQPHAAARIWVSNHNPLWSCCTLCTSTVFESKSCQKWTKLAKWNHLQLIFCLVFKRQGYNINMPGSQYCLCPTSG